MSEFQMKNKETNTFRFKSFADRVNEIDIRQSTLYRVGHENEELEDGEDETLFAQTLRKWIVLNLTTEFSNFYKKVQGVVTLPQLLYKKDIVAELLASTLESCSVLSLEAVLDALVAFARDIREEFYPYFNNFLGKLIHLLRTPNPDQLEWTLKCIAHLFKMLRPFLKRNISIVLGQVFPLLDDNANPDYIVNFASECFSFVVRDIKDFDKFIQLTIKQCATSNSGSGGCGKLFFELVRGVGGNFHSIAKNFLKALLCSFTNPKYDVNMILEIVSRTTKEILENINQNSISQFWEALREVVTKALEKVECLPEGSLLSVVNLIKQAAEWKKGKAIVDVGELIILLTKIVDSVEDESIVLELSSISTLLLHSDGVKLQQIDASKLICKMLTVQNSCVFEHFIWNMRTHPQFEVLVLPSFIKYFENSYHIRKLDLLVRIVAKRTEWSLEGEWKRQPLKFKNTATITRLEENIRKWNVNILKGSCLEEYLLSVILYPHLIGGDHSAISVLLKNHALNMNFTSDTAEVSSVVSFLTLQALANLNINLDELFLEKVFGSLLENARPNVATLLAFNVILDYALRAKKKIITKNIYLRLHQSVANNLSSSHHLKRKLSSKVLSFFKEIEESLSVYQIFYDITEIEPTVHTYREQLLLMQKLASNGQLYQKICTDSVKLDCVRFLLGHLHQNFKLIWEPTMKLIEEYADKLPVDDFWSIYRGKLEEANAAIKCESRFLESSLQLCFECEFLNSLTSQMECDGYKVEFCNYRNLLWQNMSNFGLMIEMKNRDVVGLFLDFVENEYKKQDEANLLTWNVLDGRGCDEAANSGTTSSHGRNKGPNLTLTTLSAMLDVFVKQTNPKQLYREREIKEFYFELLTGTNENLQKLALDCLMRYKLKSCLPYKEHLYALIDDKKFKDEIVNFKLDVESKMIAADHRSDLMPILLRILYGKMRSKTSNKYISSQMRRSIVMRFLTGCQTSEIFWFLQMAFESYEDILKEDLDSIPNRVKDNFKLDSVLSPKKLRSALNLLELIRKHFGGLMGRDVLIYMLKLDILAGSVCRSFFENKEKVDSKYLAVFRNLRSQGLEFLVEFFEHFQEFKWEFEHIKSFLDVYVWPVLPKMPEECLHSPTPLLRLFMTWSQNAHNYRLLVSRGPTNMTPIGVSISLLASDKPTPAIRKTVMQMIERVLMMEEEEQRDNKTPSKSILNAYVDQLLQRLVATLNAKGRKTGFGKRELFILSRMTEMELPKITCEMLLKLILPIATMKSRVQVTEESTAALITTLMNLMSSVDAPEKHVRSIMPLFEHITDISTRKQLCRLLMNLSKNADDSKINLKDLAEIAEKLNAWDRKWIEQPDYDKRLSALRDVRKKLDDGEVNMELGLLVVYNCFYFLNHDKDLGLRDNASLCMRSLVPGLIRKFDGDCNEVSYLVEDVMFNLIRRTLRKNDLVRNEGILLLGEMVRNCSDTHSVLNDLQGLACQEDLEVDFFENITHLQLHRHGRALLKFCSYAKDAKKSMSTRTLTQFLLPLATRYLLTEKFASKNSLVDAAIESIGTICQFLPWYQYHAVLKFYLQKMRHCREYHKQCIRIIIAILDAFHFDLAIANENVSVQPAKMENEAAEDKEGNESTDKFENEDLDSELDELEANEKSNESDVCTPIEKAKPESLVQRPSKLSSSAARNVIETITKRLLPSLNHSITALSSYESKHKLNRRRVNFEREEEESLRVPIALAMAKLLKKLPKATFDAHINGVFLKVCTFLKSPVKSVRMLTRDILKKIMLAIGAEYLPLLLSIMTSLLTKGFQVHVLSVTLHSLLDCMRTDLRPQIMEKSLQNILDVTVNDIFGNASEEKEVEKIGASTPEAKPSIKSYLSLQLAAQNIPPTCMLDLLMPFKCYLQNTESKKVLSKIQDCFQKISLGLAENVNVEPEMLVEFIYGVLSESIPDLVLPNRIQGELSRMAHERKDCFLIPQEPRYRSGAVRKLVKSNARANAYILTEFGLELLHIVLRRKKLEKIEYLEPLIPNLKTSLEGIHVRICTLSLKCLASIYLSDMELNEMKRLTDDILKQIFIILHKYFSFGVIRKDENFQLVKSAMKTVGCVISKCDYYELTDEHTIQLLFYISQDVNETDRQPVAFSLLKSLIAKRKYSKELHEIMLKLCEISVTSESDNSREEARAVLLNYVATFYKETKTESILKFFIAQLNYEVLAGRISAVKFIESSARKYPLDALCRRSEVLFLALGTRFVNENVPECRILIAECLEILISRMDKAHREELFEMAKVFFESDKAPVREMAACLCSRFLEVEKTEFLPRALYLLPILGTHLAFSSPNTPGKFVRSNVNCESSYNEENASESAEDVERARDHYVIQIQNCMLKLFTHCPQILVDNSAVPMIDSIAYESQNLLAYGHEWVRLNSVKILNSILASFDPSVLRGTDNLRNKSEQARHYIYSDPESELRSLTLDLCAQLQPDHVDEEFASEISKCLMFVANLLKSLEKTVDGEPPKINLQWLIRRVRFAIHGEVAKTPKQTILRHYLFDWIEGIIALLSTEELCANSPVMISVLIREISEDDNNIDSKLKQKAIRITNRMRHKMGDETYDQLRMAAQKKLLMKRAQRRKELAQEKIIDPVRSAKRKSSQKERKKEAKRRKLEVFRGKSNGPQRKKRKMLDDIF